ncbi:MAG: class I SAM-dependent methyltransferase [Planctomycetales bacterium]
MNPSSDDARSTGMRWWNGLARRVRRSWNQWRGRDLPPHAAEAALRWLLDQADDHGLPRVPGDPPRSVETTGRCLPTLLAFGQRRLALSWGEWLIEQSGRFVSSNDPDALNEEVDEQELAGLLCGLLAAEKLLPRAKRPARDVCRALLTRLDHPDANGPLFLPLLREAARRWKEARWKIRLKIAEDEFSKMGGWRKWLATPSGYAGMIAAFLDLGRPDAAKQGADLLYNMQKMNGAVHSPSGPHNDTTELAHLAACWYRLGMRNKADPAMRWLRRHQNQSGGFFYKWPLNWSALPLESIWTAKYFLDACLLQTQAVFESADDDLPDIIGENDGRMQAVFDWLEEIARPGLKVADVGCGSGRFLKRLKERFPQVKLHGIDASAAALEKLPKGIKTSRGDLLNLPREDGAFDAAFSVEALEHSLVAEAAVDELCRVVSPGGRILIIDKHVAKQSLSEHHPWERWFAPDEVREWLLKHCEQVEVAEIAHGSHAKPTGLFLCWTGTRSRPSD